MTTTAEPDDQGRYPWEMTVEELLEEASAARDAQRHAETRRRMHLERESRVASPDLVTQVLAGGDDLHRFTPLSFFRAVPGLFDRFKPVPKRWWRRGEMRGPAIVRCPCGQHPQVPVGSTKGCECERLYFFDGSRLHVANSPQDQPADSS